MSDEKRRFSRIPFRVNVEMAVGDVRYTAGGIENLSVGGCLLPIEAQLDTGKACRLRIALSETEDGPHVAVDGEVVRCGSGTVAVRFTSIDPDSLFHLKNIIRYNFPNTYQLEKEFSDHPGII